MTGRLATLALGLGLVLLAGGAEARERAPHRHDEASAAPHERVDQTHRLRHLQRKHDLRRLYHDRRPRRPMGSM